MKINALALRGYCVLLSTACLIIATPTTSYGESPKPLVVSAAASLKNAFSDIGTAFIRQNRDVEVRFNFASSSSLANQIEQGAPVDVYAAADISEIYRLADKELISRTSTLAKSSLVLIVSKLSKVQVNDLGDLTKSGVRFSVAQRRVPVSKYGQRVLTRADQSGRYGPDYLNSVRANIVSEETDVRMLVLKVMLGEATAAIVYQTDVRADVAKKVNVIQIPSDMNVTAHYGIAVVRNAPNQDAARLFFNFLSTQDAVDILDKHGFKPWSEDVAAQSIAEETTKGSH